MVHGRSLFDCFIWIARGRADQSAVIRINLSYLTMSYGKIFVSSDEWQEINDSKHKHPHAVNEVPVHLTGHNRPMVLHSEVAAQRAHQNDRQENQTYEHMRSVKTGQCEKR